MNQLVPMGGFHHIGLSQPSWVAYIAINIPLGKGVLSVLMGGFGFEWGEFFVKTI